MSAEAQREAVRRWFGSHPAYYKQWTARHKIEKAEARAAERVHRKLKPPVVKGKITYSINLSCKPLTMEERINHEQPVHHRGNKEPAHE